MKKSKAWVKVYKPNYQRQCSIQEDVAGNFVFSNIRDFTWKSEDSTQKQKWIDDVFSPKNIEKVYLFNEPFWPWNLIAHTMISFHFTDWRNLCLSIEAPLYEWKNYSFRKAITFQYAIMYIRWTQHDHVTLRTKLRWWTLTKYLLNINKEHAQELFLMLIKETQKVEKQKSRYNLIANNCLTAMWRIISAHFQLPRWHWSLLLARFSSNFFAKLDLIRPKGKRVLRPEM